MSNTDVPHYGSWVELYYDNLDTYTVFLVVTVSLLFFSCAFPNEIGKGFDAIARYFLTDARVDLMLRPGLRSRFLLALLIIVNLAGTIFSIYALAINDFIPTFFLHNRHANGYQWMVYISNLTGLSFYIPFLAILTSRLSDRIREHRLQRNPLHRSLVNLFPSLPSENYQMETLDPSKLKEVKLMVDFDVVV